ncbi:hypothetical protein CCMA1212_002418 [Trichoderma ghanense]|uniref:Uncharacterized protein n=1 Tax=Trichoderma ghanense TaxID=65468 RepID=A0ABY2HA47_9HYPO
MRDRCLLLRHLSMNPILEPECPTSGTPTRPGSRKALFQSFADIAERGAYFVSYKNGFVEGIIRAFQQDLHLVLRPDDFSFYVNGHAEKMRKFFVSHERKKQLIVDTGGSSPLSLDFNENARAFKDLSQGNVDDPELTSWILPNFSTTTVEDITTTTKSRLGQTSREGGKARDLWRRTCRLEQASYRSDREDDFETFDQPDSQTAKDFWMRAVHQAGEDGSLNVETLSGWVTLHIFRLLIREGLSGTLVWIISANSSRKEQ